MAKTVISLDMDLDEPMIASELREFLAKVPDDALITGTRYATYDSDTNGVEIG